MSLLRGTFVTGTDTAVGKTVLAAELVRQRRAAGVLVAALKPVLSGLDDPGPHDHELLAAAAGCAPDDVCAHGFRPPVSPHLAAEWAGVRLSVAELAAFVRAAAASADEVVVEGVGGLLVPLNESETVLDLALALGLPLVIAARPGLGTINHTLLTLHVARAAGLHVERVVLTPWPERPTPMQESNRETIARMGDVTVDVLQHV